MRGNTGDYEDFRANLETLLDRVDEQLPLEPGRVPTADRIRSAIKNRHGDWEQFLVDTAAQELGVRIIGLLNAADVEFTPELVLELEARIDERLPR